MANTITGFLSTLLVAISLSLLCPTQARPTLDDTQVRSTWMIQSIMSRNQGVVSSGAVTSTLEAGILSLALENWLGQYPTSPLAGNVSSYLQHVLDRVDVSFPNAAATAKLPLDRLSVGQGLLGLPPRTLLSTNQSTALARLNASLAVQKRNPEGGLWYYVYRNWSYLDGVVSFLPFMAKVGWSRKDMRTQIVLLWRHCYDLDSGLLVHGYDYSKTAVWANKATGGSRYVWGRALGWHLAGLVNGWEALQTTAHFGADADGTDADSKKTASLETAIRLQMSSLTSSLVRAADDATGAWWQLPTLPGRPGNFLESSSTMLFVFALHKAVRLGLAPPDVLEAAQRAWDYTWDTFVIRNANGTLSWNGTVASCSLNSTASYEYYTTRPIVLNSLLGEAAFVLAALQVEKGMPGT